MVASSGQTSWSGSHEIVAVAVEQQRHQRARVEEPHPGAHPVAAPGADAEPVAEPLGEPALDTLRGHHHDLLGERVVERRGEQLAEGVGELVGARRAVEVEGHLGPTLGRRHRRTGRGILRHVRHPFDRQ